MFRKDNQKPTLGNPESGKIKMATNQDSGRKISRSAASGNRSHPSIIAQDVRIEGSVRSKGDIQIDGVIQGDVLASKAVIGREGSMGGELIARDVVVHGKLKGTIQAATVHLSAGSNVEGDIVQTSLVVDSEARFTGQIRRPDDKSGASTVVVDNQRTRAKPSKVSVG